MRSMVFLCLFFLLANNVPAQNSIIAVKYDFETDGLAGWNQSGKIEIDSQTAHGGKMSLTMKVTKDTGGCVYRGFTLPEIKDNRPRLFRFSFFARSQNLPKDGMNISLLKCFAPGREAEWFDALNSVFMTFPGSPEWTNVQGQGIVGPEVKYLNFYLRAGGADGQAWFDDLTFELLDRGLLLVSGMEGNLYVDDQGVMDLVISGSDHIASGSVSLFDEADRLRSRIEIRKGTPKLAIPLPARGHYVVKAEVAYDDGIRCDTSTTAAVVGPLIPDQERMKSRFGFVGHGSPFIAAGARWDRRRVGLEYDCLKKAADENFAKDLPAYLDEVPGDRTSIYYLWPQPVWLQARKDTSKINPFEMYPVKDWELFRKLVQYTVKNTSKKPIEYVEVANEPDEWKGSWKDFVKYCRIMGEAAKSVHPNIKFMGPSFCVIKVNELRELAKLGFFKYIDALSIHAYVRSTPPEEEFIRNVRDLRAFLKSIGKADLPIFFTEYGWPVPPGDWQKPVDPLTQARYCSRSLILLTAEQIDGIYWFCLRWPDPTSSAYSYGLLNWDSTPRPGYAAYANAARCLTNTTGPGRNFWLTPTTHLTLFRKGTGTIAALWTTQGEDTVVIPKPWTQARDMMGQPIQNNDPTGKITVSPSPIFIELPGSAFYDIKEIKHVTARQEGTVVLPWEATWTPAQLQGTGTKRQVVKNAPKGPYMVLGKSQDQWQAVSVKVNVPLEIQSAEVVWPADAVQPKLQAKVQSELTQPAELSADIRLTGASRPAPARFTVAPQATTDAAFALPALTPGKRYTGELVAASTKDGGQPRARFPLDVTIVPCLPVSNQADMSGLPVIDFTKWAAFTDVLDPVNNLAPDNCSATMQVGYADEGLRLRFVVRDSVHYQNQGPKMMWQEDSIQVAFDMDRDLPWKPNQGGADGHSRVFEYGLALGQSGPMTWRWISYDDRLPRDMEENRIVAKITRDKGATVYDLTFPWATLGLDRKPAKGSTIGLALAVQDSDNDASGRRVLTLFQGIVDKKDPSAYGRLWIR